MKVLVTGANGLIGSAVIETLAQSDMEPVAGLRNSCGHNAWPVVVLGDLCTQDHLRKLDLSGIDAIVHTAGRAHVLEKQPEHAVSLFRQINTDATLTLASRAATAGVRRFIFLSSIGVNGNVTAETAFDEDTKSAPHVDYAQSKWEAEQGLWEIAAETDLEVVIVRPPLVISGRATGNLNRLMGLVHAGIPLPLASVNNQRSLVALENLVDFISACLMHPEAADQTFVISDNDDISTPEMVRCLADGMGKKALLLPFPLSVMSAGAKLLNRRSLFTQLCCSLQIDSFKARGLLGWSPSVSVRDALRAAGREYAQCKRQVG